MQPTEPILCKVNFALALRVVMQFSANAEIFIAVPNAINGKLDMRPVSVWVGKPGHIRCLENGKIQPFFEKPDFNKTELLLDGFTINDILEFQSEFRTAFEYLRLPNMIIWRPKKNVQASA